MFAEHCNLSVDKGSILVYKIMAGGSKTHVPKALLVCKVEGTTEARNKMEASLLEAQSLRTFPLQPQKDRM